LGWLVRDLPRQKYLPFGIGIFLNSEVLSLRIPIILLRRAMTVTDAITTPNTDLVLLGLISISKI
jgi:hypothetical protein